MNTLILTVGLPRSGKTTWAMGQGHPVVNPDSIRLALHGQPFYGDAEPYVWAIAKTMVQSLFLAGHETVIVDATNTTRKRRDAWLSSRWCRDYQIFGGPEDKDVCLKRARQTAMNEQHLEGLEGAIERMAEQWEAVDNDEYD